MKLLVYDCEIVNAIPFTGRIPEKGITYCRGWQDYEGMGISVICAYLWDVGYRVFLADNLGAFKELAQDPETLVIGFNNRTFDDRLLRAHGIEIPPERSWDLLRAVRAARGANPDGVGGTTQHALCQANFLAGKTGSGADVPLLWQTGKRGQVIDYCLNDTLQLKKLIELVLCGRLRDPESGRILKIPEPGLVRL